MHFRIFVLFFPVLFFCSLSQITFADTNIDMVETYVENQTIQSQYVGSPETKPDIVNLLVEQGIGVMASIIGLGVAGIIAWVRRRGIPVSSEQEKMFKDVVTKRFEKLAKQTWIDIRNEPDKLEGYWKNYLSKGRIPEEFVHRLKTEGKNFALELKNNREFRDFAKNLSDKSMDKLLEDLRTQLKDDYQKRMIDVLPKLASIAVDAAYDEQTKDVETWSKKAIKNLKPLLLSSEALDTEENLMIIIKSEINKRLQRIT